MTTPPMTSPPVDLTTVADSPPTTDTITISEFERLIGADPSVRILDVRTGGEFETAHIPGSYNVPLDTLGEHARDLADVSHPVVLVCQSGSRAGEAHARLADAGKQTLHILDGGISAWQAGGGDVIRGEKQRWAMDRQVRLVAGSIALASTVVSIAVPPAKWIAGGVGAGLAFSAVSNTCAMAAALSKLPYNRTAPCDINAVLRAINEAPVVGTPVEARAGVEGAR